MSGTTPQGITNEKQASVWVRGMFGRIAGRYDFLNHVLSFNMDRVWRARTVRRVAPLLKDPQARILDLCCGTLAILEFSTPQNRLFASLYRWFSISVLPRIGGLISGSSDAYSYLPESIRKFPDANGLKAKMEEAGYAAVDFETMTFGTVALHWGTKRLP